MERLINFQVGRKLVKVWRWVRRRQRISSSVSTRSKSIIRFCKWSNYLHHRVKIICSANTGPSYARLGQEQPKVDVKAKVPKGYLAVYVGESNHKRNRVMVPVNYFSHPLFRALLEETKRSFGHDHAGGIQIPHPIYIFENVKTRIAIATATHRSFKFNNPLI